MNNPNRDILFIAAGPISWASSRMRCFWPAKYMDKSDVIVRPKDNFNISADYSTFVFQKFGDPKVQAEMREYDRKVIIDCCDPVWWFSDPEYIKQMFDNADGATFSNVGLQDDFYDWYGDKHYPTEVIFDRVDFDHFQFTKQHWPTTPVRFIWYGVSQNRVALYGALENLQRLQVNGHRVQLTIFDDRPDLRLQGYDDLTVLYSKWEYEKEPAMISGYDISLLPPYPGPWGEVKSNNKNITSWACGVPTTTGHDYDELVQLMDYKERRTIIEFQTLSLKHYDVKLSGPEFLGFANEL